MHAMVRLTDWGMKRFRNFSIWEVGVFKCCLFSLGMLAASYCGRQTRRLRPLLWGVTLGSYVYLIWRMVFDDEA